MHKQRPRSLFSAPTPRLGLGRDNLGSFFAVESGYT